MEHDEPWNSGEPMGTKKIGDKPVWTYLVHGVQCLRSLPEGPK